MGETMNTDKPDFDECIAGKGPAEERSDASSPKKRCWLRTVLKATAAFLALCALLFMGIIYVLMWYSSRPGGAPAGVCMDNVRTIDSAIMYEKDRGDGLFPTTIDDLIPTYLRESSREPMRGTYSLDTSGERPIAVCSIHGTSITFDNGAKPPSSGNSWLYAVLLMAVALLFLAVGIGVYTWKRSGSLLYGRSER
jgi:hypothetical protein